MKIIVVVLSAVGIIACIRGISTLLYFHSFTETTQGIVDRSDGKEIIVRFHEERSSPPPHKVEFKGDAEYAFPANERTENLKVGDTVEVYHAPGKIFDARLDKDVSYLFPIGTVAAGIALISASGVTMFICRKRPKS